MVSCAWGLCPAAMSIFLLFSSLASCTGASSSSGGYLQSISKLSLLAKSLQQNPPGYIKNRAEIDEKLLRMFSPSTVLDYIQGAAEWSTGAGDKLAHSVRNVAAPSPTESQEKCLDDMLAFTAAVRTRQPWALQMLDAFGKPGPGITRDNLLFPGAYDLCRDVRALHNVTSASGKNLTAFSGQYCDAVFLLPTGLVPPGTPLLMPYLAEGICVPDSCSEIDLVYLIDITLVFQFNSSLKVQQVSCQYDPPLDKKAIAAMAVCGVFAVLVMLGTLLDMALVQVPKWRDDETLAVFTNGVNSKGEREPLLMSHTQNRDYRQTNGACGKLLTSFSLYTNGSKLLNTKQAAGSITSVHGVRFISMTWVVLGHTIFAAQEFPESYAPWLMTSVQRYVFQIIANATVAVDTFFVLSGLLVCYLSLKELERAKGPRRINWVLFYFHRFWRLTPVYMAVLFFYVALQPHMGRGPAWTSSFNDRDNCHTTWWTNLLYVNNFVQVDKLCMGHSWYLADDMQFYVLSPLIFIPFYYSAVYGCVAAAVFFLACSITPAVLTVDKPFPPGMMASVEGQTVESVTDYMSDFYIKPYTRMAPYVVGMVAGYILYRMRGKRMNKLAAICGWLLAAGSAWWSLFGLYDSTAKGPMPVWEASLYNAVGRTGWGASVAFVIIACTTGGGGPINSLLSWSALVPLSRLTYCVYLVHLPLMYTVVLSRDTPFYMSDMNLVMFFFGNLSLAYLLAAVVSLVFEAPMMGVEKVLFQGRRQKETHSGETRFRAQV